MLTMYRGRRAHQIHFNKPPSSHFSKSTAIPGMTTSVQQPPAYSDRQCSQASAAFAGAVEIYTALGAATDLARLRATPR